MSTTIRCPRPECALPFAVEAALPGSTVCCPTCQNRFRLPDGADTHRPDHAPTLPTVDVPGQVGRFVIRGRLGAGTFGAVYRAYDPQLDREVALKLPHPGTLDDPARRQRFLREARAAAGLRHPCIVPLFEAVAEPPTYYLATGFVDGQSLGAAVRGGPLEPRRAARLVQQLAEALAYAHGQGVIHRDVKPGNVLLDAADQPHLLDFGLAYRQQEAGAERLTQEWEMLGTPAYMAPELVSDEWADAGPAADQYALGVVLYELLTGQVPFEGPAQAVFYQALHGNPTRPGKRRRGLSRDLETVCLKAMARRPQDRYASCAELAEDLRRWLAGEPIRARRQGPAERLAKWARRNPAVAGLTVAVLVTLVAGTVVSSLFAWRATDNERKALKLAEDNEELAGKEKEERDRAEALRREAERRETGLALDRGISLCEQGNAAQGMLWLARSLEMAVNVGDPDLERVCRANLCAWQLHARPLGLQALLEDPDGQTCNGVAVSPDGKILVAGGWKGMVRRWDLATGKLLGMPIRHATTVRPIAFCPDGRVFVVGCYDGKAYVYDGTTGEKVATMECGGPVYSLAFTSDGKRLLTGAQSGEARLWRTDDWKPAGVTLSHDGLLHGVAVSPDGRTAATTGWNGIARLWDLTSGKAVGELMHHPGGAWVATFSPDGKMLLTGCYDGKVRFWDAATGKAQPQSVSHASEVYAVAYSPDGRSIFTGSRDATARLWDAGSGLPLGPAVRHNGTVFAATYCPSALYTVATTGARQVKVWQCQSANLLSTSLPGQQGIETLLYSSDSHLLAGTTHFDQEFFVWDLSQVPPGRRAARCQGHALDVTMIDGRTWMVVDEDRGVIAFDREAQGPGRLVLPHPGVHALALGPDGSKALFGDRGGKVVLWDLRRNRPLQSAVQHQDCVMGVAFSPDGSKLFTGSYDTSACIWEADTGRLLARLNHPEVITHVAVSRAGLAATACEDGKIRLWDLTTNQVHPYIFQRSDKPLDDGGDSDYPSSGPSR